VRALCSGSCTTNQREQSGADAHSFAWGDLRSRQSLPAKSRSCIAGVSFALVYFDASFKSTAVLVNSHAASTYVDVTVHGADGKVAARQRIPIAARNQVRIDIGELLASARSSETTGSVQITPATDDTGIGVIGQMSLTYDGSPGPSYLDYEPAKPGPSNSLVLRGVADAGQSSPIVGITSVAATAQHVTVQCFATGMPAFSKTVTVPAMGTVVTPACNGAGGDPLAPEFLENLPVQLFGAHAQAKGISLTTDAAPGSFAAFGFAPHPAEDGAPLTAVPFSDPSGSKTSTTIFAGLPVGGAPVLAGGYYEPQLSVANFSTSPAQITVRYSQTAGDAPEVKTVATLVVPADGTSSADLTGLRGDPDLQNTFEVVSDQPPGEVFDNVFSKSETGIRVVELPGKDLDNSHNAGNHPWTVADGTDSTILLFNETTATEDFPVLVSSGQTVWSKKYSLAPLATKAIDINEVIADQVKDDKGSVLPHGLESGEANWYVTPQFGGTGRVLQSNRAQNSARSFSCGEHSVIIGADFYPNDTSESDGQTNDFGEVEAQFGLTEDSGGCSGDYVGDGDAEYYFWSSLNTSIATISGAANGSSVSVEGMSPGTASIEGNVEDADSGDYCESGTEAQMTVTPSITSISPSTVLIADTGTSVTITGTGFGTSPTLNLPTGVSPSGQSATNTQITVTLTASGSATVGNSNITVTVSGQTSNTKQLVLDGPYQMEVTGDTSGPCSGCTSTIQRSVSYQAKNFSGSNAGIATFCEVPSPTSWNCSQGQPGVTANSCPSNGYDSYDGTFIDSWTLGSNGYTPTGCGLNISDPWYWAYTSPNTPIGTPAGFIHTNAIEIDGVTTPSQLSSGTIMPK
jgi:hypothetical protein